tara:strand:+ start:553 stop:669 length:117 start_codon:yes stop_codon:yes gene_type:complete
MIKYIIAAVVVGIIAYGGWYLYQDNTSEEFGPPPTTQE